MCENRDGGIDGDDCDNQLSDEVECYSSVMMIIMIIGVLQRRIVVA